MTTSARSENIARLQKLIEQTVDTKSDLWIWYPGGLMNNPTACYSSRGPAPQEKKDKYPGEMVVQEGRQLRSAEDACPAFLDISCIA